MKVAIIQDRMVMKDNSGNYYRKNISEYIKYLSVFDKISYVACIKPVSSVESHSLTPIDKKVSIIELPKKSKLDKLILSKQHKSIVCKTVLSHDLLIIKFPSLGFSQFTVDMCLKYNKKYVIEVVGCAWLSMWYYNLLGKLISPYAYLSNRKYISKANYVIYVTQKYLQDLYPNRGLTIGCSNVMLHDSLAKSRHWSFANIKEYELKIATIGPVDVRFRDQMSVLKALNRLFREGYSFQYTLIGSGDPTLLMNYAIKHGFKDKIYFAGQLSHADVLSTLDGIDLYIHPSKAEGLPRSLIEAMSRAVPCLAANTAGNPELLDSDFIFRKGDFLSIYNKLLTMNGLLLTKMSEQNLERSKRYLFSNLDNIRKSFFSDIFK